MIRRFLATVLLAAAPVALHAQADAPAAYRLTFDYDRPGLAVPHWQITIPPRGQAMYTGKPDKGIDPGEVWFPISPGGREKLGTLMEKSNGMKPCETHSKGIAKMGQKTVEYQPAGGTAATCSYNFTDNKALGEAAEYVIAVSGTIQVGLELERLHRYDRLGLDPVMIRFAADAKEGRVAEIGAIRPTLESLVKDPAVLERVRTKAQQLLEMADQQQGSATAQSNTNP